MGAHRYQEGTGATWGLREAGDARAGGRAQAGAAGLGRHKPPTGALALRLRLHLEEGHLRRLDEREPPLRALIQCDSVFTRTGD